MSVCEINYLSEQQAFEVKFYLFQDDLKEVIYGDPNNSTLEPKKVTEYILQHIDLRINGITQILLFKAMQEKNDQVLVTFQLQHTDLISLTHLQISNQIMVEKFRKQTNMVFLQMPDRDKLSLILNAKKTQGEFKLD